MESLKRARKARAMSLAQVAERSGLHPQAIARAERDGIDPRVSTAMAIATDKMWVAVPTVAVVGFAMSTAGIAIQTAIQVATDRAMRGRVMGLYGLIFRGAPAVGALGAGLASAYFGLQLPVLFGALIVLAVCLWTYLERGRIAAALEAHEPTADV